MKNLAIVAVAIVAFSQRTSCAWYAAHVSTSAFVSNAVAMDHGWEERSTKKPTFVSKMKIVLASVDR